MTATEVHPFPSIRGHAILLQHRAPDMNDFPLPSNTDVGSSDPVASDPVATDAASSAAVAETLPPDQVTELLVAWKSGRNEALETLMQTVYRELRALAGGMFRSESSRHTLQPTALVHEAFLRLVDQQRIEWKSRAQFFAVAGCLMRRILVDHARARVSSKRGGGAVRVTLSDSPVEGDLGLEQLIQLSDALDELASFDEQQARVVESRYFAGMTIEETADALGISPATVKREWTCARAFLLGKMNGLGNMSGQ